MSISPQINYSYSGWLKRKGKNHGLWHRRFAALSDQLLIISKDESLQIIEETIPITEKTIISTAEMNSTLRFMISNDNQDDPSVFSPGSEESFKNWMTALESIQRHTTKLTIDDFHILSVIGRGFYGKVMLVQKKGTDELYAIKSIRKSRIVESGKATAVINERNIMMRAKHPFVVNLCFTFQTQSKVYLGLEYAAGGEMFYHMGNFGVLPYEDTRLYIAEIGLAINHMHALGIIYRDLKPENILLDEKGHIKLTDFGLSKEIKQNETTSTFCGTSEYLAPEILNQLPYDSKVDEWAIGILTYEMLFGTTPFLDDNKSFMFDKIIRSKPTFPDRAEPKAVDFISQLLCKKPNERPAFASLMSHPFFEGLDWDKVYRKVYSPGFIPPVVDVKKPNNFDPEFTCEIASDSFVQPVIGDIGKIQGFSYTEPNHI